MKRFSLYLYLFTVILNMDLNLAQNLHAVWEVCAYRERVPTFHQNMTVVTSRDAPLKRKLNSTSKISSRKKRRKDVSSLVDLPWAKKRQTRAVCDTHCELGMVVGRGEALQGYVRQDGVTG